VGELKVSQFGGYVAEHTAYRHGDESLNNTIIGMAQDFLGSNNFAFLVPCGQFGTRRMMGRDAASPRYTFTRLHPITRALFPVLDDPVLVYRNEEGMAVEPIHYVPVLPTLLLNGSSGIGTGFSSDIPSFSPTDIVQAIEYLLCDNLDAFHAMTFVPWFKGFQGTVVADSPTRFKCTGCVHPISPTEVHVTELPPGIGTDDFVSWANTIREEYAVGKRKRARKLKPPAGVVVGCEEDTVSVAEDTVSVSERGKEEEEDVLPIVSVNANNTDTTISVRITFADAVPDNIVQALKLTRNVHTSNMYAYTAQERLFKYETVHQIILDYYPVRLALYEVRKRHLLQSMQNTLVILQNKVRFLHEIITGTLDLRILSYRQAVQELAKRGYHSAGGGGGEEEGLEKEKGSEKGSEKEEEKGYEYMLGMKLHSITPDRQQALIAQLRVAEEKYAEIESTDIKTMWHKDIQSFKN
jgi:DNA topoisomerase-2